MTHTITRCSYYRAHQTSGVGHGLVVVDAATRRNHRRHHHHWRPVDVASVRAGRLERTSRARRISKELSHARCALCGVVRALCGRPLRCASSPIYDKRLSFHSRTQCGGRGGVGGVGGEIARAVIPFSRRHTQTTFVPACVRDACWMLLRPAARAHYYYYCYYVHIFFMVSACAHAHAQARARSMCEETHLSACARGVQAHSIIRARTCAMPIRAMSVCDSLAACDCKL